MSKLAIVQALSDSAPQPERLRAMAELQSQISAITNVVDQLAGSLTKWARTVESASESHREKMLDVAVLIQPIMPALTAIQAKQTEQDGRLEKLEVSMSRVMRALPTPRKTEEGKLTQPRLASQAELTALPAKVWAEKPGIFK